MEWEQCPGGVRYGGCRESPPWGSGEEPPIASHLGRPGKAMIPTISRNKASQSLHMCHFLCLENSHATHSTNSYSSFRTQCKSHFFGEALLDSSVFLTPQVSNAAMAPCAS